MPIKKQKEDFDILISQLANAYRALMINRLFLDDNEFVNQNFRLWIDIRAAFTIEYLLGVAKIFERPKNRIGEEVLSIYYLVDIQFSGHEKTIEGLKKFRSKFLVHNDLKIMRNPNKLFKNLGFTPDDIKNLLERAFDVLEDIKSHYGLGSLGNYNPKNIEKRVQGDLKNFKKWAISFSEVPIR